MIKYMDTTDPIAAKLKPNKEATRSGKLDAVVIIFNQDCNWKRLPFFRIDLRKFEKFDLCTGRQENQGMDWGLRV